MIKPVTLDRNIYSFRSTIVANIKERFNDFKSFQAVNWYENAQRDLLNILSLYPAYTYPQLCAVCSALSPACKWADNIKQVEYIILEHQGSNETYPYTTYGANVAKARELISTKVDSYLQYFKTPKTRDFYLCLLDPLSNAFVIDRHMLTIAGIESTKGAFPTSKQYGFIVDCYKEAIGYVSAELQAFLWSAFQFYFKQVRHY